MSEIVCRFPARLHFGLLDMNGSEGRVDGGIGLAIQDPATELAAAHADRVAVTGADDSLLQERLERGLRKVCALAELPGVRLDIRSKPPAHSGFGSATQILVGAAKAVTILAGRPRPAAALARVMRRGGTSGIGTAALDGGGFIVDGGHAFGTRPGAKRAFAPSRASDEAHPPPVLARTPFPEDWQILISVPRGLDIDGKRELEIFERECPVPDADVARMCRILLMRILPALAERDLEAFGAGLEDYQNYGFKQAELRTQTESVRGALAYLRELGAKGAGMSSWGPCVYAFGLDLADTRRAMQDWLERNGGGSVFVTRADNVGHRTLL